MLVDEEKERLSDDEEKLNGQTFGRLGMCVGFGFWEW